MGPAVSPALGFLGMALAPWQAGELQVVSQAFEDCSALLVLTAARRT